MSKDITITKILEKDVWEDRLETLDSKVVLDSGSESLKCFAIIETPQITVGISYEEDSVYPKVKKMSSLDAYLIGADNRLFIVDQTSKTINQIDLQSFFIDAVEINNKGIVIVEEVGIGLYDLNAKRKWFVPTDLVESYLVERDTIIVRTESTTLKLSTASGNRI